MSERPIGGRFSHIYLDRGAPGSDSARFRHRLSAYLGARENSWSISLVRDFDHELGVSVTWGSIGVDWTATIRTLQIRDLLDAIPFAFRRAKSDRQLTADNFRNFVERAMREENLHYTLDEAGGVHPYVDAEFQNHRLSTIAALGTENYRAALADFQRGMDGLVRGDTLAAVRGVFDAVEGIFKQEFSVTRLGKAEIDKNLGPLAKQYYTDRAGDAAGRLLASFGEWVNGAHQYRHADGAPEPTPPPRELAVAFITAGTAWIRWLTETNFLKRSV